MRVAVFTHAILIATCFHFTSCDHHASPKLLDFPKKVVAGNSYCNSLIFGHSKESNFLQPSSSDLNFAGSLYFCHPTSSTAYVRCSVSEFKGPNDAGKLVKKVVVKEDEFYCKPGTHFSSLLKACVSEKRSNCAARFNPLVWSSARAHEQTLCKDFVRKHRNDSHVAKCRLICHDRSQSDFVVCPVNSAFAEKFSCAKGMFFNQALSKCVSSAGLSDCPVPEEYDIQAASMRDSSNIRECICKSVLAEHASRKVAYAGNPEDDKKFLICLRDGRVFTNTCPGGNCWNERVGGCARMPMRKTYPQCEGSSSSDDNSLPVIPVGGSHDSGHYSRRGGVTSQQRCVCDAALQRGVDRVFYRCDPHGAHKFLTCARGSVTVHSCPRNLFWNGQSNGCSPTKACRPIPSYCKGESPTTPAPLPCHPQHLPQSVAPIQRCICADVLRRSGRPSATRCDPLNENGYLVCTTDGAVERMACPNGQKWNVVEGTCSTSQKKCMPVPKRCTFDTHVTTPPPPTTTTSTTTTSTTTTPTCFMNYTLYSKKLPWHTARLVCEANLSELAVILNNETQALLTEKYGSTKKKSYGGIWIGASDAGEEGSWRWVTGPLVEYSNWYPKQPSGYKYQHCMQFNYYKVKGAWDDTRCYYKKKFLCQKKECSTSSIRIPST